VYGESEIHPRIRRAEAFQRYIVNELFPRLQPDLVHCNDWMTGLVPASARAFGIKSLFTLHNVFTEFETPREIDRSGIDVRRFREHLYYRSFPDDSAENWNHNKVDFTATGIHAADIVNTVSPTFLEEIVAGDFEDIIPPSVRHAVREKHASGRALGILNAPGDALDPRICPHVIPYDVDDVVEKKRENKERLQQDMGLRVEPDRPVLFWPSRLYAQKGPELLLAIVNDVVSRHGAQIAIVASGDRAIETAFRKCAAASGGSVAYHPFREELNLLGHAGSDFVLMPSRYEPCGIPQMIGPRFGTLPIARATGGLKDTITAFDETYTTGNGFAFGPHTAAALSGAIASAVRFFRESEDLRRRTLQRVMRESLSRFTLANTAREYIRVYERMLAEGA
jgi:ADP-glucose type glycogen/starch synthase